MATTRNVSRASSEYDLTDDQQRLLDKTERLAARLSATGETRHARVITNAVGAAVYDDNPDYLRAVSHMKTLPVTIEEFINSKEFLGDVIELWPALKEDLYAMHPDHLLGDQEPVLETLLGGATGWGKSFLMTVSTAYCAYYLTCFDPPHALFRNLDRHTPIILLMQSIQERVTERVLFKPMRQMFLAMPYTQRHVRHDKKRSKVFSIEGGIEVIPTLASIQSFLGSAVICAALDEVNFMAVVEQSKQVSGPRGKGGRYDQAQLVYTNLRRRRTSRFITQGPNPGGLYVSSSVHYEDDFLERRMRDALDNPSPRVKVIRRAQYDARPEDTFSGDRFRFMVGNNVIPARIITDDEVEGVNYPDGADIREVPIEYLDDFRIDPDNAQRDVIGIASSAINRFITQVHKIHEAVELGTEQGLVPFVVKQNVDLREDGMPQIVTNLLPDDRETSRYVHIDLSMSNDRTGIAMAKVGGWQDVERDGVFERLPVIHVELAVSIKPHPDCELDIAEVRRWVLQLKTVHGFNISKVTYDMFQSQESIQLIRKAGIMASRVKTEDGLDPFETTKSMLYEGRIAMVNNGLASTELAMLEKNEMTAKIDHPPTGSKDVADAIAGASYTAATARSVRMQKEVGHERSKAPTDVDDVRRGPSRRRGTRRPWRK